MATNKPTYQLRKNVFGKDEMALGEHARDTQKIFDAIPVVVLRTAEGFYSEPYVIGQLSGEPFCIELVRILNLTTPTAVPLTGGMCQFTYQRTSNSASIASIDGMKPDTATKWRMFFRITYAPVSA